MRFRVVRYNILAGGEGRADPLAEVLLAQRADVVLLEDVTDRAVVQRLAERLDTKAQFVSWDDRSAAFLCRWPMRALIDYKAISGNLVFVAIWVIAQKEVSVAIGPDEPPEKVQVWASTGTKPPRWIEPKLREQRRPDDIASHPQPSREWSGLLVAKGVTVVDAWVERDRLAVYASNHLPVGVEVEI